MATIKNSIISGDEFVLPNGTSQNRPSTASEGQLRFNSNTEMVECYYNNRWAPAGAIVDFDMSQSGTVRSFGIGNAAYYRSEYEVSVTTSSPTDVILLRGRMNYSTRVDEEVGWGWGASTTSGSGYSRITDTNLHGNDSGSGRYGVMVGTHDQENRYQMGDQIAIYSGVWTPGTIDTWYIVPAIFGNGGTNDTMYINRYHNNSGGSSNWDNATSSTVTAMVIAGGIDAY